MTSKKKVITFHYQLKNDAGDQLESSRKGEPISFLEGAGNIIPGLEKAIVEHQTGETFTVTVPPQEAYGFRNESLVRRVPIKHLRFQGKLKPGSVAAVQTTEGPRVVHVVKAGRFHADIDANHPLAGQTLTFEVEITDTRDASEEEVNHGHAHGPGGHQHD